MCVSHDTYQLGEKKPDVNFFELQTIIWNVDA